MLFSTSQVFPGQEIRALGLHRINTNTKQGPGSDLQEWRETVQLTVIDGDSSLLSALPKSQVQAKSGGIEVGKGFKRLV